MFKLILTRGLPAAGKSKWAEEKVKEGGNFVRLNKDLLRTMLHFDRWTGRNERITMEAEKDMAYDLLEWGHNVIIDDTNLGQRHEDGWKDLASLAHAEFEIKSFLHIPVTVCVERDWRREKSVGSEVIWNMALQYNLYKPHKGYILCDLDGTLCDITHRLPFVKGEGKKDWKGFFAGISKDELRVDTLEKLWSYVKEGYEIVFVSARPDDHKEETLEWLRLKLADLPWTTLIMRRAGDRRPDTEVKKQILYTYFKDSNIHAVIDDRPCVIEMWRKEGLNVIDVGSGIDF